MSNILIEEVKKFYFNNLSNIYPPQTTIIIFINLIGLIILRSKTNTSLIKSIDSTKIIELTKLLTQSTIGDFIKSLFLTFLSFTLYFYIKKYFFFHLSKIKGFPNDIKQWEKNYKENYKFLNEEEKKNKVNKITDKINLEKKKVISLHLIGQILLSIKILVIINIIKSINRIDIISIILISIPILIIQRETYLYYLRKLLPKIIAKHTLLEKEDFSHKKAFSDEFHEN